MDTISATSFGFNVPELVISSSGQYNFWIILQITMLKKEGEHEILHRVFIECEIRLYDSDTFIFCDRLIFFM